MIYAVSCRHHISYIDNCTILSTANLEHLHKNQYSRSQEMERVEAYDIPWSMASYKTEITKYYEPSPLGNK
jgi:hypothetical protein